MSFTNNFRVAWWFILLLIMGSYLYVRYPYLAQGKSNSFDLVIFISWLALSLGPLFNRIEFFGIKLFQEVQNLKKDITSEISELRAAINVTAENTLNSSPQFNFSYPPPPDSQLDNLESVIKGTLSKFVKEKGLVIDRRDELPKHNVPDNVLFLFKVRLEIEDELRSISELLRLAKKGKRTNIYHILSALEKTDYLNSSLIDAVKKVYSVCSPAIHGFDVSDAQIEFVKNTAPNLIQTLESIRVHLDWE